jgi:O-acetyl-ADP-ribose deacetylase (regulator of RNase III)
MRVSVFVGDIAEVEAEAICTSTNPRLSLVMGTGAALRERGGFAILRACEAIVRQRGMLPPGSAWPTIAGTLPAKVVIHCVASDDRHRSSEAIIAACVRSALARAAEAGCRTVAMPIFASGHARIPVRRAMAAMTAAARESAFPIDELLFVVHDAEDLG